VNKPFHIKPVQRAATPANLLICVALLAGSGSATAQTLPAVSELNGKVDYAGGTMDGSTGNNLDASITVPVCHPIGFQADALYSKIGPSDFYGGAGHLFWRNPDLGLLGLTGGYVYRKGVDTFQLGGEGQYYLGPVTLGFFGGLGQINYAQSAPFIDTNPTRFIGRISADYYPIKDLRVGLSYTTAFEENLGRAELEYQTPICGLALTAEASVGNHGYDDLLFGVRYYFGAKKSLRDRQRQDDPPGLMTHILQGLGLYGAEYNQKGNAYLQAHSGGGGTYSSFGSFGSTITSINGVGNPPINPIGPITVLPPQ
jgi:hypothetical protein